MNPHPQPRGVLIDFRAHDTREHTATGDRSSPVAIQTPDDELQDRIRAALTMQRYVRDVARREASGEGRGTP